jgi:pimeloyl-ACP methyl ester carboxylesterase
MTTAQKQTYADAPTKVAAAAGGFEYAYRDVGSGTVPLVLLQHFRGNLDNWDPALIDALASHRRVIAFDNVGVGATNGTTPNTVEQMAADAILFLEAMEFDRGDILGFSIGSFVAQEIAPTRPSLVGNLILASSAPKGADGMHGWAPWVIDAVGKPEPDPVGYLKVFFTQSASSRQAANKRCNACSPGPLARTSRRPGRTDKPNTTPCAPGAYRTTHCCNDSARSAKRCLSPTATATP